MRLVVAIFAASAVLWPAASRALRLGKAAVVMNGVVCFGSTDGNLYALE